jgi:hypothetical protein
MMNEMTAVDGVLLIGLSQQPAGAQAHPRGNFLPALLMRFSSPWVAATPGADSIMLRVICGKPHGITPFLIPFKIWSTAALIIIRGIPD